MSTCIQEYSDSELVSYALNLWANYIETGDVVVSAVDAEKKGMKIKALNHEQMKIVVRLRDLAIKSRTEKLRE